MKHPCLNNNRKDFEFKHVSEEDIFSIVLKLNNKKQTSGNIPTKILKCVAHICNKQLAERINYCIDTNIFPDTLKLSEIKSLHKTGDKTNKENYRPISILSTLSKVYERVISSQLSSLFETIFNKPLCGFRKKYKLNLHYSI